MDRLTGKVAIVTGAAQGIGRAIASRLADEGAKVALADIQFDAAERVASEIRSTGAKAIAVALDVTNLDDAIAAADRVERELGPIDILVNNAGWDVLMPFVETSPDLWDKVIAINYRGDAQLLQGRGAPDAVSRHPARSSRYLPMPLASARAAKRFTQDARRPLSVSPRHSRANLRRIISTSTSYVPAQPTPLCSRLRWRGARKSSTRWRAASRFAGSDNPRI